MMRHELRRFHLSDRERTLANLILSLSWEEGLPSVRVPKLEMFQQLSGISIPHCSTALKDLEIMRVVKVTETEGGKVYAVNPQSETWQVKPRQSRATILSAMNMVRELNGIKPLTEGQLNFKFHEVTHFLQTIVSDLGTITAPGTEAAQ